MESTQSFAPGLQSPRLRDVTGHDERAVDRADSGAAIELIARLAETPAGAIRMTAFERDLILARIFTRLYGDRIESTLECRNCGKPFDIAFSLQELTGRQPQSSAVVPCGDGTFRMEGGLRFRLPTGEDELSVLHLSAGEAVAQLLQRCVLEAPGEFDASAVQDAMEQVAPILDVDISPPAWSVAPRPAFVYQICRRTCCNRSDRTGAGSGARHMCWRLLISGVSTRFIVFRGRTDGRSSR